MAFDYKKEFKEFYLPKSKPSIVDIPTMNYAAVRGKGDPNEPDGEYRRAVEILYGVSYTIKMSKKGDHRIDGYFDYVVPPLEGLWQQRGAEGMDYSRKNELEWTAMIRLPDFVTKDDLEWAVREASAKKKSDFSSAEFFTYTEGLCVQCMHTGSYDSEPGTVDMMNKYIEENGYVTDMSEVRRHHEIYLNDPRRTDADKLKTVIRHPISGKTIN
ncbi:MAG: GyrI-like domain-containing protein [Ruminiclostridium sp.]|nr:GyrI-like domain-containing protein [Ruminiclostridium sp.]